MGFVNQAYAAYANQTDVVQKIQMDDTIYLDRPQAAPLLAFIQRHNLKRMSANYVFHYLTKTTRPPYIPLSQAYDSSGAPTAFYVANGSGIWFEPGGIFFLDGVQYRTTSVTPGSGSADDTVTASAWPSTQSLADATSGTNLIMSYQVFGDLTDAPVGNWKDAVDNYNYCEQMMSGVTMSKSLATTDRFGKNPRIMAHAEKLLEFKTDIEMKFLLSKRYKDSDNASDQSIGTIWNTGGMDEHITSKVYDFSAGTMNIDTLLQQIPDLSEFAEPEDWIMYVPSAFLAYLQIAAQDKLWYDTKDDSFGYTVRKWTTSFGDFPLIRARMLDHFSVNAIYLLNKNEIKKVTYTGEDQMDGVPKLYMNAQLPNQPNKIHDFYRGVMGLQRGFDAKHCKVYNWT